MLLERFAGIAGKPGLKEDYSIVEENLKMNPECPCLTRTCPNHGFCIMCVRHHKDVDEIGAQVGKPAEGTVCDRIRRAAKEVKSDDA